MADSAQTSAWIAAGCTKKQLAVLELRYQSGFSLRQIALALDLSVSTVRTHLQAADRRVELYHREAA